MAAAYAALNSLMYILQQIQNHPRPPITLEKQHMDSLSEIICFLQDFLENYSHRDIGDGKEALESQIANAAYAAEDVIETHIVDQILAKSNFQEDNNFIHLFCRGVMKAIQTLARISNLCSPNQERSSNSLFCQDLQKVIEDMNLIKEEAIKIQEKVKGVNDDQPPRNISGSSAEPSPKRKNSNTMVGFDDVLKKIMDMLTGYPPKLQVLPIIGMGGIGKTTLARNVYDHQFTKRQFDVRIWVRISQEYRLRDIFLEAFSCLKNDEFNSSEDELGNQLYKILNGRRYLIVLDDMWSIEAWEKLMWFFPDNNNGSRIMITTRLSNVADHFGPNGFKMNFLDEDKSWDLFCKTVFPQDQCCPPKLKEIGMVIARNCGGLPLSIVVIGGLLAKSEKTHQHWKYIAENLNPIINSAEDMHCLKILYWSYNHLPIHLKPCFLYMGVFPEDETVSVSLLKRLWVAEGFLKPIPAKSLEVGAEEYLKDLIDRNLILTHDEWSGSSGKIRYCKIHDLLRDLCLREAKKDKFLWVHTAQDLCNLEGIQSQRRIVVDEGASKEKYDIDRVLDALPSASLARSFIGTFDDDPVLFPRCRLLRVFDMDFRYKDTRLEKLISRDLYKDIFKLVNTRYLRLHFRYKYISNSFSLIHLLWNLQMLIIHHDESVPLEIWEMPQLRYLDTRLLSMPDPPNIPLIHDGDDDYFILRNLQKIKRVRNFKLSEEIIKKIPNIKKLGLFYDVNLDEEWRHNYCTCLNNLGLLNKLESLSVRLSDGYKWSRQIDFSLPHSLKKLSLECTKHLREEDMRMIGSLPHLQVLKLMDVGSFLEPEWNPIEGEFLCLKFLLIQSCRELVYWNANSSHFPCLEQLHLRFLRNLEEIPRDIGNISTLQFILLEFCSDSAVKSAKNLLDEQVELGNEDIQVRVTFWERYHLESLRSHNFQVQNYY